MIVNPLHAHFDAAHMDHVIGEMRRRGPPRIRAFFDVDTRVWFCREGTHRLRAAKALGLVPVMVPTPWPKTRAALERARFRVALNAHHFPDP